MQYNRRNQRQGFDQQQVADDGSGADDQQPRGVGGAQRTPVEGRDQHGAEEADHAHIDQRSLEGIVARNLAGQDVVHREHQRRAQRDGRGGLENRAAGAQDDERADEPAKHRKPPPPAHRLAEKRRRQRGDDEREAGKDGVHFGETEKLDGVGEDDDSPEINNPRKICIHGRRE